MNRSFLIDFFDEHKNYALIIRQIFHTQKKLIEKDHKFISQYPKNDKAPVSV